MTPSTDAISIEATAQIPQQVTVAEARVQLARLDGRPAIALNAEGQPLGLLLAHRLLAPDLLPPMTLAAVGTDAIATVPCLSPPLTLDRLQDLACLARSMQAKSAAGRYAIAVNERGVALGTIDLLTIPTALPLDIDFASGVERFAHDAATPLMSVLSLATLLGDERLAGLETSQRDRLDALRRSAERVTREHERLDFLARVATGRATFYPEPISLDVLCHQAIERVCHHKARSPQSEAEAHAHCTIEPGTIAIDRRLGLHLLSIAIDVTLGQFGSMATLRIEVNRHDRDVVFRLSADHADHAESGASLEQPAQSNAMAPLDGLRVLVDVLHGDISFYRAERQRGVLSLLLPDLATELAAPDLLEIPQRGQAYRRAIIWTLSHRNLDGLMQPDWYLAFATSMTELLGKIERLAPQLIVLDYAGDRERQTIGEMFQRTSNRRNMTIVELDVSTDSSDRLKPNAIVPLRYPLIGEEVARCFRLPSPVASTVVLIDRRAGATDAADRATSVVQLRRHCCRTIKVSDIDRAALFADIWQPDAVFVLQDSMQRRGRSSTEERSAKRAIERLANRLAQPCIVFDAQPVWGQACRLDRSLIYWHHGHNSGSVGEPDVLGALRWLHQNAERH